MMYQMTLRRQLLYVILAMCGFIGIGFSALQLFAAPIITSLPAVDGQQYQAIKLGHNETFTMLSGVNYLVTCPSDPLPADTRWTTRADLVSIAPSGLKIYEYQPEFITEKDPLLYVKHRWSGERYGYGYIGFDNLPEENLGVPRLESLKRGYTYFMTASFALIEKISCSRAQ